MAIRKVTMSASTEGVDQIKAQLQKKLDRLTGVEVKRVLLEAGIYLVHRIRQNVHSITGTLSAGIFASMGKPGSPDILVGVSIGARGKAPHGWLVEHGHVLWRGGVRKKGQGHPISASGLGLGEVGSAEVPPHPYFQPGIEAGQEEAGDIIAAGLKKLIEE